ncbi:MAG: alanine racemase [Clostridia bacterium]|nr:alanine racemase [Clostridia bacterium]
MRIVVQKEDIRQNYRLLKERAGVPVIPVLKAGGYGLGAEGMFEILKEEGASLVAVSRLEEALPLCGRGVEILVLSCYGSEEFAEIALEKDLTVAVGSLAFAKLLSEKGKKVRVHLKIDTGMGRFGFMSEEIEDIAAVFALPDLEVTGIFSHCSAAFLEDGSAEAQLKKFNEVIDALKARNIEIPMRHIANSSASLKEDFCLDAVRIGSALTGRLPVKCDLPLKRAGRVEAEILSVRTLPAGSNLGYGNVCKLKKETAVAVVAAGTADGFAPGEKHDLYRFSDICRYLYHDLRLLLKKPCEYARIGEKRAPMLGRPATTHSFFDVTGIDCRPGDRVVLELPPLKADSGVERAYE